MESSSSSSSVSESESQNAIESTLSASAAAATAFGVVHRVSPRAQSNHSFVSVYAEWVVGGGRRVC